MVHSWIPFTGVATVPECMYLVKNNPLTTPYVLHPSDSVWIGCPYEGRLSIWNARVSTFHLNQTKACC
jgi:hypothetical protein